MSYSRSLKIKVRCPKTGFVEPMQVLFSQEDKGLPGPIQGCESYNGSETCMRCIATITLMFLNGLDYYSTDIISPDFSILK